MPGPDEIAGESGIGFFHNTWHIKDVPVAEALDIVAVERRIAEVVGQLARDEDDFERLAGVAESAGIDDPAYELSEEERFALEEVVPDDIPELEGLDLGVAGLVHALATVRFIPAASCRSHTELSWSEAPVVVFAATELSARTLQPLVAASGCTFERSPDHPGLLAVRGRSIKDTMDLADAVMANYDAFA
jgi:hypothetical protein